MDRHIIIALTLALGLFAVDKFVLDPVRDLLDILQFPERDHSAARQRFRAGVDEFDWYNSSSDPIVSIYFGYYTRALDTRDDAAS